MTSDQSSTGLQLRSTVKPEGVVEVSLQRVPIPEPSADEVLVRVEASPINPSDLGLLFAGADLNTASAAGTPEQPIVSASIPPEGMRAMAARVGQALPVGNEGAGVVIRAGSSAAAQALLGKTVAILGGAMYAQYRCLRADQCLLLPEGTTPAEGAACFVNPLTVLAMVETMRVEGHSALVHTAAASNLGQMLQKVCSQDGIGLVNIVRKPEHVELLRSIGATHVCNSGVPTFMQELTEAIVATGATLAFDAIGGGKQGGQILTCMEIAALRNAKSYSRYGSTTHKQLYVYGTLDRGPIVLHRSFGAAWGVGGFLLTGALQKLGAEAAQRMRRRVADEIKTTFASHYKQQLSLAGALRLDAIADYAKMATGEKYLITPQAGMG
jgi:NADPH2:quinone reductase